ncbi:MAG: hypothetical protein MUP27_05150, partial [Desulfobacterales bacterium]|nr:hypothetical protein [Desulfobacterales bacterium]
GEEGLWGQIFILDFGEHRESGLPIRQKERGPYNISARQRQRTAQQRALTEFSLEKMANEYFL